MENNQKQQQQPEDSASNKKELTNSGGNDDTPSTSSSQPKDIIHDDICSICYQDGFAVKHLGSVTVTNAAKPCIRNVPFNCVAPKV